MDGEVECGDYCLVTSVENGVLVAVVDGIGHGPEAALAARSAADIIETNKELSSWEIARHCHEALRSTRGVVLSLAVVNRDGTMTWIGIGNVEGRLVRWHEGTGSSLLLRTGLIGDGEMPTVWPLTLPIRRNDILVLATDGIRHDFDAELNVKLAPDTIAENILSRHGNPGDDSLVFVARFEG